MGSSYFGEPNMGNERGSGSSSSSRRGKKNNPDKPKQPQRGLGVAQLEKIRLHGQMASAGYHPSLYPSNFNNEDPRVQTAYSSIPSSSPSYSASCYGFHPNIVMGLPEYEGANMRYGDSHPANKARWEHPNAMLPSSTSIPFSNLYDSQHIDNKKQRSGQNSESSDTNEVDLELRLSL